MKDIDFTGKNSAVTLGQICISDFKRAWSDCRSHGRMGFCCDFDGVNCFSNAKIHFLV